MKNSTHYISKVRLSFYFLLVLLIFLLGIFSKNASAVVSSCTASVSPSSVVINTTREFTFSLINTSTQTINWIKITRPSSNFTFSGYNSIGGFTIATSTDNVTLTGSSLAAGVSTSYTLQIASGNSVASSADWTIQVSDDGGSSTTSCSGNLGTAILASAPDTEAPQISELTISEITSSSVKITWNTDENATSVIDYGTTADYGSTKSDSSLVTSHSINIDSLSANTTYHFNTKSTDSTGNTEEFGDETFITAKAGLTSETVTITNTKTVTPTPTPTPIPDTTGPFVTVNTDFSAPFEQAPSISGSAYDASGISKIEYSTDNGKSWIPIRFDNVGDINIRFDIKPEGLEEDNYKVKFRSFDTKSNIGYSKTFDLVIDRLPPKVGGAMFFIGPQVIFPKENGSLNILQNIEHSIVFSAVGGPIKMELFAKDKKSGLSAVASLRRSQAGLWTAKVKFETPGEYSLVVKAEDGAGKKSEKKFADINVVSTGKILDSKTGKTLEKAKVTVYLFHPKSKKYVLWDGKQYLQQNPIFSDKNGQFSLYLPAGKYYITVSKAGYISSVSEFFSLENPEVLNYGIMLSPKPKLSIGPISLYLPDFFFKESFFTLQNKNIENAENPHPLMGKEAPDFSLKTVSAKNFNLVAKRGTPLILTFVSSWSPPSLEQILVDNKLKPANGQIYLVDIQEPLSKISIFQKRGGYSLDFIVDSDGALVEPYGVNFLPMHFVLDRKGMVRKVINGVLNKEELENYLKDVSQ